MQSTVRTRVANPNGTEGHNDVARWPMPLPTGCHQFLDVYDHEKGQVPHGITL
jgi:hypothetical protein